MEEKKDNIYIYLWKEFNTVYIGRSKNPKSRHYQHKHRATESTYKFSSEHNIEHPNMIIIENDLSIEEGIEREKYWINYYRENSEYTVLNKSKGGQVGKLSILTPEERKINQKKYYQKNKESKISYQKSYREKNYEKIKNSNKKYYETNKIKWKTHYEANKQKLIDYQKKYNKMHRNTSIG